MNRPEPVIFTFGVQEFTGNDPGLPLFYVWRMENKGSSEGLKLTIYDNFRFIAEIRLYRTELFAYV